MEGSLKIACFCILVHLLLYYTECSCTSTTGDLLALSVTNGSSGVNVSIAAKMLQVQLPVSGQYLSKECGSNYFRCKDILVEKVTIETDIDDGANYFIAFLPLVEGVMLLEIHYNSCSNSLVVSDESIVIDFSNFGCNPTAFFKILNSIYTICLNLETNYLNLFEIRNEGLHTRLMSRYWAYGPLIRSHVGVLEHHGNLSEFKYVNLEENSNHLVYFATENRLYLVDPLNYIIGYVGELATCQFAKQLVYARGDIMVANCREGGVVVFDLIEQNWIEYQSYVEDAGQSYVCLNGEMVVTVINGSYVQIRPLRVHSDTNVVTVTIDLMVEQFDSGECFGDILTHFVYADRDNGVYVLDISTIKILQLCSEPRCEFVQIFDNRYVVLRKTHTNMTTILVKDSNNQFNTILQVNDIPVQPDLVYLISTGDKNCCNTEEVEELVYNNARRMNNMFISLLVLLLLISSM